MKENNIIKDCLNVLNNIACDSQEMQDCDFLRKYQGRHAKIIMAAPIVFNESMILYRSRRNVFKSDEDLSSPSTFSYIPFNKCTSTFPSLERANYAGQPMFYGSIKPETNIKEVLSKCEDGEVFYMGIWKIRKNSQLHLYPAISPKEVRPFIQSKIVPQLLLPYTTEDLIEYLEALSNLLSSTEKGCYLASSYIYNCILDVSNKLVGGNEAYFNVHYDGILYPSARGVEDDWNFALLPSVVDNCMELIAAIRVIKGSYTNRYTFREIGLCSNQVITWYNMHFDETCIKSFEFGILDEYNYPIDLAKGIIYDEDDNAIPLLKDRGFTWDYILNEFYEELVQKANSDILVVEESITKDLIEKLRIREFCHNKQKWRYDENGKITNISQLYCRFEYKVELIETDWHKFLNK